MSHKTLALFATLIAANLLAWGWAIAALQGSAALLGTALLAYGLGLRHAVDADHIAAIDNVTRKLLQEGRRPLGIGCFFALGHATVVIVAATLIAASATTLQQRFPGLLAIGETIGTGISAIFLLAVAGLNAAVLAGVYRRWRHVRRGGACRPTDIDPLPRRGMLAWALGRAFLISRSWHMFPLGLLFGLGFDTASEIGLLGIAAGEAAHGLPIWAILVFPALFTAGMSLVDAADGLLMIGAYGWALADPGRRLTYNLAVTGLSVMVAGLVGGMEALELLAGKLDLAGGWWDIVSGAGNDLGVLGVATMAVFSASWALSALAARMRGGKLGT